MHPSNCVRQNQEAKSNDKVRGARRHFYRFNLNMNTKTIEIINSKIKMISEELDQISTLVNSDDAKNNIRKTIAPVRVIYLEEYIPGTPTENVVRIKDACGKSENIGSICLGPSKDLGKARHPRTNCSHLDLKIALINEIARLGGDFLLLPVNPTDGVTLVGSGRHGAAHLPNPPTLVHHGASACWGGRGYVSWRAYPSLEDAVSYLKRYFLVKACMNNSKCTQAFIDSLS